MNLLILFGGACALAYEVLWLRLFALACGGTAHAAAVVLAVFMGGLGLGSALGGRFAERLERPLRAFGLLEIALGLYALATPALIAAAGDWGLPLPLAALVLLVPSVLMGATYPILVRAFSAAPDAAVRVYAWNTAGAVTGTLATGFVLLPALGVSRTLIAAAAVDMIIGAAAAMIRAPAPAAAPRRPAAPPAPLAGVALAAAAVGAVSLALEALFTRQLVQVLGGSVYAFTAMLAAFLAGIAGGAAVVMRLPRERRGLELFGWLMLGAAAAAVATAWTISATPLLFLRLFSLLGGSFAAIQAAQLGLILTALLPVTLLLGMGLPLLLESARGPDGRSAGLGLVYAANSLGAAAGALGSVYLLLPLLGGDGGMRAVAFLALAAGAAALRPSRPRAALAGAILGGAVLLLAPAPPRKPLAKGVGIYAGDLLEHERDAAKWSGLLERGELQFYRDGVDAAVAVWKSGDRMSLVVNGKIDASDFPGDMFTQLLIGHLPVMLARSMTGGRQPAMPDKALVIGLGSGVTLSAVAAYPIGRIDCVEIEPAVVKASGRFAAVNNNVLSDPRVRLHIGDGRRFLARTQERYPLIISQPSNPWLTGVSNLFTLEQFQLARSRLTEDGIFAQWFQLYSIDRDDLRSELRTFQAAFPDAQVWQSGVDLILIGTLKPGVLDAAKLTSALSGVSLEGGGRFGVPEFLDLFALGPQSLSELVAGAPLNTDDRPLLEFSAPKALYRDAAASNIAYLKAARESAPPYVRGFKDYRRLADAPLLDFLRSAFEAGDAEAARAAAEKFASRQPAAGARLRAALGSGSEAEVYLRLGQAYGVIGRLDSAAPLLEKAVNMDPKMMQRMVEPP